MFGQAFLKLQPLDTQDILNVHGLLQTPDAGDYLGANAAAGFDRTLPGRVIEETNIQKAEDAEGTADSKYRQAVMDLASVGIQPEDVGLTHAKAMPEKDWKESSYYREGMQYRPDMTETRARIMADNYDERRHRDAIVAAGDQAYSLPMRALGFGAMMLGTLPDPVNFIPFTSGLNATKIGAQAGIAAAAKAGAKAGVISGAAGNALVDAIALPDLKARGEDVGFADLLLDTAFGAVLGGVLGGIGGALGGYVGAKRQAHIDAIIQRYRNENRIADFDTNPDADFLYRAGQEEPSVPRLDDVAPLEEALPRNDDADVVRAGTVGLDRRDLMRAQEKAIADVTEGRPVDVGQVLRESQALGHAYDIVRDNPLGGPPDEVITTLSSPEFERILVERGPARMDAEGAIVVRDKAFARQFGSKAWGMVKIIWRHGEKSKADPRFQVSREDVTAMPRIVREFEPVENAAHRIRKNEHRWVVKGADGVDTVYAISRRKKGYKEPTLISIFKDATGKYGASEKRSPLASSAGENPHSGGKSPNYRDTSGGGFAHSSRRQGGDLENTLITDSPHVNYAVEQPDNFPPAPELETTPEAKANTDANISAQLDAAIATRLAELEAASRFDADDAAFMAAARDLQNRAKAYDELGQSVLECVWTLGA